MRLVSLEVENFRKFRRPHRIDAFGPRLNVLCGPNEFGKSTLLAALSAALFHRHGSRTAAIRALQTHGSETAPRVAVGFTLAGETWHLEKRFIQRPFARLTHADGRRFDDDAAETRLRELLGVEAGGKPEHLGLWNALWVTQGSSFVQASVDGGSARTTIARCLEAELGGIAGFGRGDALLRTVEAELAGLRDRHGKPVGARRALGTELAALRQTIEALQTRRDRLACDVAALLEREREHRKLRAEIEASDDRSEILRLGEDLARARLREAELSAARAGLAAAEMRRDRALAEIQVRAALRAEGDELARASEASALRARQTAQETDDASDALAATRAALAAADAETLAAEKAVDAARAAAAATVDRLRLAEASGRLGRAREVEAAIAAGQAALAAMSVDRPMLEALRRAERDRAALHDRLQAQATSVEIVPLPGGPAFQISVGGRSSTPGGGLIAVIEDTDIVIDGVGAIRLRPAVAGRDATLHRSAQAERHLAALLRESGSTSPQAAEEAFAARERQSAANDELARTLAGLTPGDPPSGLQAGTAALAVAVETLRQRLASAADPPSADLPHEGELSTDGLREAENERTRAADAQRLARAREQTASDLASSVRAHAASDRVAAELARARAVEREAVLREADHAAPSSLLDVAADAAAAACQAASDALSALRPDAAPDTTALAHRIARLEEMRTNREVRERQLGEGLASLRARIDAEGGAGLDETLAAAERSSAALELRLAALDRETAALDLLAETLRATVGEARAATMLPLTRRIAPRLATLIPGATVECDADFRVGAVLRDGGSEPFEMLSDGTREQIAILARLAYAGLLVDRDRPAMVILDDALAFSDATRVEHMFDILAEAAERTQILVLTCRADLFARLGGTQLSLEPVAA